MSPVAWPLGLCVQVRYGMRCGQGDVRSIDGGKAERRGRWWHQPPKLVKSTFTFRSSPMSSGPPGLNLNIKGGL